MHGHDGIEVFDCCVGDTDHQTRDAGIVHQAIKPAEPVDRVPDHRLDVTFTRDVGADEAAGRSKPIGDGLSVHLATGRQNETRTVGDKSFRDPKANSGTGTGHDRDLAVESVHV
jgi:hypothetical protein